MDVSVASSEARLDLDTLPVPSVGRVSGRAWHLIRETGRKLAAHVRLRSSPFSSASCPLAVENGRSGLLAKLNHDIRTPLNAIIGFSELFLHQGRISGAQARALAENIQASGHRLLSIVEALLDDGQSAIDFAALDKQSLNLRITILEAFAFLRREIERSGCASVLLSYVDLFVDADAAALRHMLVGLLSCALSRADADTLIITSVQPDRANSFVEFRCTDLAAEVADEDNRAHLALINALALAHGGRLSIHPADRATVVMRLTFFATRAVQ